ncbi:MAG TPA: HAD family hydrolase, partial [Firmicutes bacterium]|nr:HAD family hydrolase [Bacillota bacterium]
IRNKKPSPDSIIEIKKRLNLNDEDQIYYIGDSEVDYKTAINSNATPIIVSYGYRTKEELLEKVPSNVKVVNNCKELVELFK